MAPGCMNRRGSLHYEPPDFSSSAPPVDLLPKSLVDFLDVSHASKGLPQDKPDFFISKTIYEGIQKWHNYCVQD